MYDSSDQDHRYLMRVLLPPGTAVRFGIGAIRARPNGHLRRRIRRPLDRFLGACRTHVDLRLQERLQGYKTHARI